MRQIKFRGVTCKSRVVFGHSLDYFMGYNSPQIYGATSRLCCRKRDGENAPEYVKVKSEEYTNWTKFKGKLLIVDDGVVFEETGEFIPDMRGKIEPDKFTVTLS